MATKLFIGFLPFSCWALGIVQNAEMIPVFYAEQIAPYYLGFSFLALRDWVFHQKCRKDSSFLCWTDCTLSSVYMSSRSATADQSDQGWKGQGRKERRLICQPANQPVVRSAQNLSHFAVHFSFVQHAICRQVNPKLESHYFTVQIGKLAEIDMHNANHPPFWPAQKLGLISVLHLEVIPFISYR